MSRFDDFTDEELRVLSDALHQYAQTTLGRDRAIAETLTVEVPLPADHPIFSD